MNTGNASAQLRVTSKYDGDIGLGRGGAQKFPKVEFTHLFERWVNRSQSVDYGWDSVLFFNNWNKVSRSPSVGWGHFLSMEIG